MLSKMEDFSLKFVLFLLFFCRAPSVAFALGGGGYLAGKTKPPGGIIFGGVYAISEKGIKTNFSCNSNFSPRFPFFLFGLRSGLGLGLGLELGLRLRPRVEPISGLNLGSELAQNWNWTQMRLKLARTPNPIPNHNFDPNPDTNPTQQPKFNLACETTFLRWPDFPRGKIGLRPAAAEGPSE